MNEKKVREILERAIADNNALLTPMPTRGHPMISWPDKRPTIFLDGLFPLEQLEAIVWWMKNKGRDDE